MSAATGALIVAALIGGVILLFRVLQYRSDKTYRPTAEGFAEKLRQLVDGRLKYIELDELACVPIAYDERLERLRARFRDVVYDNTSFDTPTRESPSTTTLSAVGRARVGEIIDELDKLAT